MRVYMYILIKLYNICWNSIDILLRSNLVFRTFDNSIHRIGKVGNQKRVVGVLLGSWHKKVLDVSNSFAGE